ncbi:cyclic-phosphate processing receiver domain-containing protein [Spirillospora sp. NPDC127200]
MDGRIILGVDDLRSLPSTTRVARTSREGVLLLEEHRDRNIDELWLDHDLGEDDDILPVVHAAGGGGVPGPPVPDRDGLCAQRQPDRGGDGDADAGSLELPGSPGDGVGRFAFAA